jgi:hypothetical protein
MPEIIIPRTIAVVARCFTEAEEEVRKVVSEIRPNADEPAITNDLERGLKSAFRKANDNNEFAESFLDDLLEAFPKASQIDCEEAAKGLIASVSWHGNDVERKTAADFGLVLLRPELRELAHDHLTIASGKLQALAVQAKRKPYKRGWRKLSERQEKHFVQFRKYGALLLYRFSDPHSLCAFEWHPCKYRRLDTVKKWLGTSKFPQSMSTSELINRVAKGDVGTPDKSIIQSKISPIGQRVLLITIDWPEGIPPKSEIRAIIQEQSLVQEIRLTRY